MIGGRARARNQSYPSVLITKFSSYWSPRFDDEIKGAFPPALPATGWPVVFRRAYWQLLNFVINTLG